MEEAKAFATGWVVIGLKPGRKGWVGGGKKGAEESSYCASMWGEGVATKKKK